MQSAHIRSDVHLNSRSMGTISNHNGRLCELHISVKLSAELLSCYYVLSKILKIQLGNVFN